jgi:hypothetical protein
MALATPAGDLPYNSADLTLGGRSDVSGELTASRVAPAASEETIGFMYQRVEKHEPAWDGTSKEAEAFQAAETPEANTPGDETLREAIMPGDETLRVADGPGDQALFDGVNTGNETPPEGVARGDELLPEDSVSEDGAPQASAPPASATSTSVSAGEWPPAAPEPPRQPPDAVREPPLPVDRAVAAARAEFTAAELRASAVLSEGYIEAEAIRVRGKQEARLIIQRAEERATQVLERTNAEAAATERRARLGAEAMLAEAQVRLDQFLADHVGEIEEIESEPSPVDVAAAPALAQYAEAQSEDEPIAAYEAPLQLEPTDTATIPALAHVPTTLDPSEAPMTPAPPAPTFSPAPDQLLLTPLPTYGDEVRFRVTGPLTFARIMALEHALQSLDGVSSAVVIPEGGEAATISFVAEDAAGAIEDLLRVPGLPLEIMS